MSTSSYNHIKGIKFEHSNINTFMEQGAALELGVGSVMEECTIQWYDFCGVGMGDNSEMRNCLLLHNGDIGASSTHENYIIKNCFFAYNNYRNFFSQWHAGGFKEATQSWGTIEKCEFYKNRSCTVWFDYCHKSLEEADGGMYPIQKQKRVP